jgi:hypothetical protein
MTHTHLVGGWGTMGSNQRTLGPRDSTPVEPVNGKSASIAIAKRGFAHV